MAAVAVAVIVGARQVQTAGSPAPIPEPHTPTRPLPIQLRISHDGSTFLQRANFSFKRRAVRFHPCVHPSSSSRLSVPYRRLDCAGVSLPLRHGVSKSQED